MSFSKSAHDGERPLLRARRGKRDKTAVEQDSSAASASLKKNNIPNGHTPQQHSSSSHAKHQQHRTGTTRRVKSKALQKHGQDAPSGGISSLLPSLIGLAILGCGIMAKMGFRGRATVAGIDLGTTNSVICVQKPSKGVGEIECIPDDSTNSPIVPSVVSFLEPQERKVGPSSKVPSKLHPHPSAVVVGQTAKRRIDSHPHHTLYQAKRVLGRPATDPAVAELQAEVEFGIHRYEETETAEEETTTTTTSHDEYNDDEQAAPPGVYFQVPDTPLPISPEQVGSYVVHHLMQMTHQFLGHDNVKSAVICVPAKFNTHQRQKTYEAFKQAGVSVARVVEEPTAAALAYGLHRKPDVNYILVYDFGGGTLDVSLLHVSDGFVDVMGSDGDDRLGGADFDAAVSHFLLERAIVVVNENNDRVGVGHQDVVDRVAAHLHRLERPGVDLEEELAHACPVLLQTPLCTTSSFHTVGEQLKIQLSAYPDGGGVVSAQCLSIPPTFDADADADIITTVEQFCQALTPTTLTLTSAEYNESVQPLLDRSVLPVERLLRDLQLSQQDIDEVVMVGGTTRMPQIRALVKQALPDSTLNTHIDPDITVAYGAASVID